MSAVDAVHTIWDALSREGCAPHGDRSRDIRACCPSHNGDNREALHVWIDERGKLGVHCHVCGKGAADEIVRSLGLEWRALLSDNGHDTPWDKGSPGDAVKRWKGLAPTEDDVARWRDKLQADESMRSAIFDAKGWPRDVLARLHIGVKADRFTIPVRALDGTLLAVQRYSITSKPKMLAASGSTRAPLYLHDVDDDAQVWTEGEADAISAATLGFSAVGIPGASSVPRPEWLEPARGRRVLLSFDNDGPGANAEQTWAPALAAVAREVVIVRSPVGKDIGDLLRDHRHEPDEARRILLDLAESAPPWSPLPNAQDHGWDQGDIADVERVRQAVFADAVSTRDEAPPRELVPGTGGLLSRWTAHVAFAERGAGKTMMALIITLSAAAHGERPLYLDRENTHSHLRSVVRDILDAHDDWPDVLESGAWEGRHYPTFSRDWHPDAFAQAVVERGHSGVVLDSWREVMSELGGENNSDDDVSLAMRLLITPLIRRGLWVLVLDNVGHVEKGRPKGAGGKLDAIPVGYQVSTTAKFTPVDEGEIEIKCTRSRFGDAERVWTLRVGDGLYGVPESLSESPAVRAARQAGQEFAAFASDVHAALTGKSMGRDALLNRVGRGNKQKTRGWLKRLVEDPASGVVHDTSIGYSLALVHTPGPPLVHAPLRGVVQGGPGQHEPGASRFGAAGPPPGDWKPYEAGEPVDVEPDDWRQR